MKKQIPSPPSSLVVSPRFTYPAILFLKTFFPRKAADLFLLPPEFPTSPPPVKIDGAFFHAVKGQYSPLSTRKDLAPSVPQSPTITPPRPFKKGLFEPRSMLDLCFPAPRERDRPELPPRYVECNYRNPYYRVFGRCFYRWEHSRSHCSIPLRFVNGYALAASLFCAFRTTSDRFPFGLPS